MEGEGYKRCVACGETLPLTAFSVFANGSYFSKCKVCRAAYARQRKKELVVIPRESCTVAEVMEWKKEMQVKIRRELGRN